MSLKAPTERPLTDYPRPSVAVDTAVLTVSQRQLCVVTVPSSTTYARWALPGTFLHPGETLADAVLRSLRDKAHLTGRHPAQLHVFDDPHRDPRGWVLSVAHIDILPETRLAKSVENGCRLIPIEDLTADDASAGDGVRLPFDHPAIVSRALDKVRRDYAEHPDPGGLLEEPFTLRWLRDIHQIVRGEPLVRDTFRRFMEPQLVPTGEMSDGHRGRPSRLFRLPTTVK